MMQKHPMTVDGANALKDELHRLKTIERPRIIESIATARAHGDLKENAEYHAARDEQSFTEGRIQDMEAKLSMAQVVDISKLPNQGKVVFGVTVVLCHVQTDAEITYQIVGEDEADIHKAKVSYLSPLAEALIGAKLNDEVIWEKPMGDTYLTIQKIEY